MPILGWAALSVLAFVSYFSMTTANNTANQQMFEQSPSIVEEVGVPAEAADIDISSAFDSEPELSEPEPAPVKVLKQETAQSEISSCHPGYSGCLNPNAGDYDCAGGSGDGPYYTGAVRVVGNDVFGLDRDGDGMACE